MKKIKINKKNKNKIIDKLNSLTKLKKRNYFKYLIGIHEDVNTEDSIDDLVIEILSTDRELISEICL